MVTVNQCGELEEFHILYLEQFPAEISQDLGSRIDVSSGGDFFGVKDPQKKIEYYLGRFLEQVFFFFFLVVGISFIWTSHTHTHSLLRMRITVKE